MKVASSTQLKIDMQDIVNFYNWEVIVSNLSRKEREEGLTDSEYNQFYKVKDGFEKLVDDLSRKVLAFFPDFLKASKRYEELYDEYYSERIKEIDTSQFSSIGDMSYLREDVEGYINENINYEGWISHGVGRNVDEYGDNAEAAVEYLQEARNFSDKVIALDMIFHLIHQCGYLGEIYINNFDENKLDELAGTGQLFGIDPYSVRQAIIRFANKILREG